MADAIRHLLVLGDSLTFHGPRAAELPGDNRLYPNIAAAGLGGASVDLLARLGWTARDAWWALTKDPRSWGEYVNRADGLLLAVGGFDQLPAAVPTYLREGIAYLPTGDLRRRVRTVYSRAAPTAMTLTGGRLRQLPQRATDRYLQRCLQAVRAFRPGIPVVLMGPSPYDSSLYPSQHPHGPAVAAARVWAARTGTGFVDLDPVVTAHLKAGRNNPDGLHWGWECHRDVGMALAAEFDRCGWQ